MSDSSKLAPARLVGAMVLLALEVAWAPGAALAGEGPAPEETMQEREACMPDVLRLCRALIPDRQAITHCLVSKVEHLSPACHDVVARRQ